MSDRVLPREKAKKYGISSLTDQELLALVIRSASKGKSVWSLCEEILSKAGSLSNLPSLNYEELCSIKGIKEAKAMELLAILEIYKRLSSLQTVRKEVLDNPDKVAKWLRFHLAFSEQEEFMVIYLNLKGNVIKSEVMYRGNRHSISVEIDEIIRKAILLKSSRLIVAHNHPSGNIDPSDHDIRLTSRLKKAADIFGILLLDHLIVSREDYFSFKRQGLMEENA